MSTEHDDPVKRFSQNLYDGIQNLILDVEEQGLGVEKYTVMREISRFTLSAFEEGEGKELVKTIMGPALEFARDSVARALDMMPADLDESADRMLDDPEIQEALEITRATQMFVMSDPTKARERAEGVVAAWTALGTLSTDL